MGTPSLMRKAFTPYRTSEIVALATHERARHRGRSIDDVASSEGIILQRVADAEATREGFCCILSASHPKPIKSVVNSGQILFSFAEEVKVSYPAIVINPTLVRNEAEVFWHEYYHLRYSPSRDASASFFGGYSTAGVLDTQEERRANLFAAIMLIGHVRAEDTPSSLAERYGVREDLAMLRLRVFAFEIPSDQHPHPGAAG